MARGNARSCDGVARLWGLPVGRRAGLRHGVETPSAGRAVEGARLRSR